MERPERPNHAGAEQKLRAISGRRQCVAVSSLGSESEHDLSHLDAIAIAQNDRPVVGVERLAVDAGWIRGREVRKTPVLVLECHLRVEAADRGLVELNMAVWRAILPSERDFSLRRSWLSHEPDLLSDLPTFNYLQTPRQE